MDAADDVAVTMPGLLDLDFNLDDFDFDLAADEFCDAYSAFVASADKSGAAEAPGGWLAGSGVDCGGSREGTPDSGVTDGPLTAAEDGAMSAYVTELERFLLEEDDGLGVVSCPDGGGERVEEISVDDYFGDLQLAGDADGAAAEADGGGRSAEEESLAAREDEPPTSRKRARHKIKSAAMMPWGELDVTRRHLARHLARIQVPALWLPATAAVLCA